MTRVCEITGKKPKVGCNVSHAHNKTKRRQLPNLQSKSLPSDLLGHSVSLRLSTKALRTIDKFGGLDKFMLGYKHWDEFSASALRLRKLIRKKAAVQQEA